MGLLVATQGGLTRETLDKISGQDTSDLIIEIKKAYKSKLNEIVLCYSAHRTNDFRGYGKDDEIESWLIIPIEGWKIGKRRPYYKIAPENSYMQSCSQLPLEKNEIDSLEFKFVEKRTFDGFFSYNYPEYEKASEKFYFTDHDRYLRVGYVNNLNENDIVAFEISTPNIQIEGDKKQILFLPFALLADAISWPVKLNYFFNSNLSI